MDHWPKCRKIARKIIGKDAETPLTVTAENLGSYLGKPKYRLNKKGETAEISHRCAELLKDVII